VSDIRLLVRQGGGSSADEDLVQPGGDPREKAPVFEGDTPLISMGHRWEQGTAARGSFAFVDPTATLPYKFRPHAAVKLKDEDAGADIILAWNRVEGGNDTARRTPTGIGGDEVEHVSIQTMDTNLDLRGIPFLNGWSRPAETSWERLQELQLAKLNGSGSTQTLRRSTTNITVDRFSNGHLVDATSPVDLDAVDYPAGTQVEEVLADILEQWGKGWGVTLHHVAGVTHRCLLVQDLDDLAKFTSALRISDQADDWDPAHLTAPVLEPIWRQGAGKRVDNTETISGLLSVYGGTTDDPRHTYVETGEAPEDYETWVDVYHDDLAKNETQAIRRANNILNDRKRPYTSNTPSILLLPEQTPLIVAGQAIEVKSVVINQGSDKHNYVWRRIAQVLWEPAIDGRWWAHLELERPRGGRTRVGGSQPGSTTPKPAPPHVPDPADTLEKFYNANDAGGDAENWVGNLANQGGSGDGGAGTDWYNFKSNAPNEYQTTWAYAAGDSMRLEGYHGCTGTGRLKIVFTDLAAGTAGHLVTAVHKLAEYTLTPAGQGHQHAPEWTFWTAGPFEAPTGTTSVALGRSSACDWDEVSIYTVADSAANDEDAVDYGDFPHDSTHWLPSDYVLARLNDLQTQINDLPQEILDRLAWKEPVRVATTADGTLASAFDAGSSVDGVTLAEADRILIKDQTADDENGLYVVQASGAPVRTSDLDDNAEPLGAAVLVMEGSTNADSAWICTTDSPVTIGTTGLVFAELGGGGGAGHTIKENGTPLTARAGLNFAAGIVATDDAGNNETDVDLDFGEDADITDAAFADVADSGALDEVARADHLHGMPANPVTTNQTRRAIAVQLWGSGTVIPTGTQVPVRIPWDATIVRVSALSLVSGSIVVDVWKDTLANYPPTNADSITASAPITISSDDNSEDATLTGWTTSLSRGDTLIFNVDSATTITQATIELEVVVT
jgi:hypothetical protein